MTTVGLPGGGTATFPDSMTPDQITAALKKQFPTPTPHAAPGMGAAAGAGFLQGLGDLLYGGAQIGARMGTDPGGAAFANPAEIQQRQQQVDEAQRQREQAYAAPGSPAAAHPIIAGLGRVGGNIASTAPLAAVPGVGAALAGPQTALGRIGMGAGIGAAQGALQPTAGRDLGMERLKGAGFGAAGGAVGAGLGEVIGSTLGNAIAGNNTAAIDRYLTGRFRQTVKPTRLSGAAVGSPQLGMQDNRILTAVDKMIDLSKQGALELTDEAGNVLPRGSMPKTLRQFSEGLDDAKRLVFQQYDQMAQASGQGGVQIGLLPTINVLRGIAADTTTRDVAPAVARDAEQLANTFESRLFYTPSEMQEAIKHLNRVVTKGIRAEGSSPMKPVVDIMRQSLDATIESLQGPGYQQLKNQYGALRSIEKDVAGAVQREANKLPWGSGLINFAAGEELLRGVWTGDLKAIGTSAAIKGAQAGIRYLNNPNRAIRRLFEQRANPPGAVRQGVGAAFRYSPVAGGVIGGQAGAVGSRDLRPSVVGP